MTTPQSIEHLNTDCTCITLDRDALCKAAETIVGDPAFCHDLATSHPHLLSAQPMFLSAAHAAQMQAIVTAIESIAALPAYRQAVFASAPEIARYEPGPIGIFMGYDFHLGETGPRLIEINTNAGGALLNAYLKQAQRICCAPMAEKLSPVPFDVEALLGNFLADFQSEWHRQGRSEAISSEVDTGSREQNATSQKGPLRSIAIVDETPPEQYLYPEFVLFQRLFEQHGIRAVIAAPETLIHRDGKLWHEGHHIDLVYNRLTDFDLSKPASSALHDAYLSGHVTITPNPHAHALYADKRNLSLLTDEALLRSWSVPEAQIAILISGIPRTQLFASTSLDALWAQRKKLFFKPAGGYGGKATYRGDKITHKVWAEISNLDYVAQDLVQPSTRMIAIDGNLQNLKADLRAYTYGGEIRLLAARLYQGQTTNFRTPGGGFAPVFVSSQSADCHCG
ncbi:MAG: hypothetical protein ABL901_09825 [Hyphomicrobiaceae bacterium]